MLRRDLATKLLKHRENDIKIGFTNYESEAKHVTPIDDVVYDSDLDVILIRCRRAYPEDVAEDMITLLCELDRRFADQDAGNTLGYEDWQRRCAEAIGVDVAQLRVNRRDSVNDL